MSSLTVDVFVCGGGPVGLVLSYQLARLGLSTYTIEKLDKDSHGFYGRAGNYYPRTLELLDQLDLGDAIHQVGFVARQGSTFRDGQRVFGRGWSFVGNMTDTFMDYCVTLRQKFSEDIFRGALTRAGASLHLKHALDSFAINNEAPDEYKVEAVVRDADGKQVKVRAKYIIGADGGKSTVRDLAKITFDGEETQHRWVRLDGIVRTNMPDARLGVGTVESSTHGSLLWAPMDHGRTRVGFTVSSELLEKYKPTLTQEDAIHEAQEAIRPFTLEFESVDWFTLYTIRQHLATRFFDRERVLLAGDAAHTHSSAAAQGMNTGIGDAVNLGWKLAGVLKGLYRPDILATYEVERRPIAQQVIKSDKLVSELASGRVPDELKTTAQNNDANILYGRFFEENAKFTSGLGVHYDADNLLNKETPLLSIAAGHRGPDTLVRKPGSTISTRLYEITKNVGKYWIMVFAGQPLLTRARLQALHEYLESDKSFTKSLSDAFEFCTIIVGSGRRGQGDDTLGVESFGYKYFDPDETAHIKYGVPNYQGAIVCLRPDGMIGFAAMLDEGPAVGSYFEKIVMPRRTSNLSSDCPSEVASSS